MLYLRNTKCVTDLVYWIYVFCAVPPVEDFVFLLCSYCSPNGSTRRTMVVVMTLGLTYGVLA